MNDDNITQESLGVSISTLDAEVSADPSIAPGFEGQELQTVAEQDIANISEWKQIITILLGTGFSVATPNWGIQKAEVEAMSDAYAPLLNKYFPDISALGPEIAAVLVTAAILGPRIGMDRKIEDREEVPVKQTPEKKVKGKAKSKPKAKAKKSPKTSAGLQSEEDR